MSEALQVVVLLDQSGISVTEHVAYDLLQECMNRKDLATGRQLHSLMVSSRLDSIASLGDHLIRLFASCGSLIEANQVFCRVSKASIYTWNAIISAHACLGQGKRALELYHSMQHIGITPHIVTFLCLLKACSKTGALGLGRHVHHQIISSGLKLDLMIGNTLVDMYAKCGGIEEACTIFDKLPNRDAVSWNAMISGCVQHGHGMLALEKFYKMHEEGIKPSVVTYLSTLKACIAIESIDQGTLIHEEIIRDGLQSNALIQSTLIDMYAKCGSIENAYRVFDELPDQDIFSWGSLIAGYVQHGQGLFALELFGKMQKQGLQSDKVTFLCILKACGITGCCLHGRVIHDQIMRSGLESESVICNSLVDMYCKCEGLEDAKKVFDKLSNPDEVSWGVMIEGYLKHGHNLYALELFERMQQMAIKPDKLIILCALKACGGTGVVGRGKLLHQQIIDSRLQSDIVIGNALIDMYVKCRSLEEARTVFDYLPNRNMDSWEVMIAGYSCEDCSCQLFHLYEKMQQEGVELSKGMILCILKACGHRRAAGQARVIHDQIIGSELESDGAIGNALVDVYVKCGVLDEAWKVFDRLPNKDVVSWGAILAGYAAHNKGVCTFELFEKMQLGGIQPNAVIFLCILKACTNIKAVEQGRLLHDQIIRCGLTSDVIYNALVDMYAKCCSLKEARKVFDELPSKGVVSWGSIVAGYAVHGHSLIAFELFKEMQHSGIKPNLVIFLCILKACGSIGAIGEGSRIHKELIETGLESDLQLGNTLIDTYSKCGSVQDAHAVFNGLPNHDIVSWGALMAGFVRHGNLQMVDQCFEEMQQQDLKPIDVIFTCVLTACSHAGLLIEGRQYFRSMMFDYGLMPSLKHYSCIVDLLGRAGCLNEAEDLLRTMPISSDIIMWTSLLTSCKTYGNIELGRRCFDELAHVDPNEASWYAIMSNIYGDAHLWDDAEEIQHSRKFAGAQKKPGIAWIEVESNLHEFIVGGKGHLQSDEIHTKLERISNVVKHDGHVPLLNLILSVMADETVKTGQREDT